MQLYSHWRNDQFLIIKVYVVEKFLNNQIITAS